jgi:hypothetical protein
VVNLGEVVMILELHRQGLKVAAIARQLGVDRKTVRKYIARGLEPPTYGPRPPQQKSTDPSCYICASGLRSSPASPPCGYGGNCASGAIPAATPP